MDKKQPKNNKQTSHVAYGGVINFDNCKHSNVQQKQQKICYNKSLSKKIYKYTQRNK